MTCVTRESKKSGPGRECTPDLALEHAGKTLHRKCPRVQPPGQQARCTLKPTAPFALQRASARLLDGAELGAVLLPLFAPARMLAVTAALQRAVLRNTRSDCEPGARAAAKSARAYFADGPIRDSDAKEVRQAFVLILDHWQHAQTGETHSVGWYASRLGLEKRQVERYYTVLADLLALHLHQPPHDAEGVPRGPSGHPYNLTTWVMGLSAKAMRAPEKSPPPDFSDCATRREPVTSGGKADQARLLRLALGPPSPAPS